MIRPFTAVCVLLAGASGLYLYTEKHRTTVLDQQISKIVQNTQHIRERTAMLRAEWALLNQPDRLQSLSARFLPELHPMAPTQFVQMATLARHLPDVAELPPIQSPATGQIPATGMPVAQPAADAAPDATLLAPIQIMARRMTPPAIETPAAPPSTGLQLASSAIAAPASAITAATRHRVQRLHGPVKAASLQSARTTQASRMAAYDGAPVRSLVSTAGAGALSSRGASAEHAYLQPVPMQAAAWRMTTRGAFPQEAGPAYSHPAYPRHEATAQAGGHSSLGFSHAAMPAPVPLDGD